MLLPQKAVSRNAVKRPFPIGISIVFLRSMAVCAESAPKDFPWKFTADHTIPSVLEAGGRLIEFAQIHHVSPAVRANAGNSRRRGMAFD